LRKLSGRVPTHENTRNMKYRMTKEATSSNTASVSESSMRHGWATITTLPLCSRNTSASATAATKTTSVQNQVRMYQPSLAAEAGGFAAAGSRDSAAAGPGADGADASDADASDAVASDAVASGVDASGAADSGSAVAPGDV